jgi:hypothetical protein
VPEGQIFGYPWPMRLKKMNPNNHLRRCPGMSSCMEYQLGPACALEGLFEALSLVSCPVALHPAVAASERIPFDKSTRKQAIAVDAVTGIWKRLGVLSACKSDASCDHGGASRPSDGSCECQLSIVPGFASGRNNLCRPMSPRARVCQCKPLIRLNWRGLLNRAARRYRLPRLTAQPRPARKGG